MYRSKVLGGGVLKLLWGLALAGGPLYGLAVFYDSLLAALPLFLFYMLKEKTSKPSIPYAVAILAGVLLVHCQFPQSFLHYPANPHFSHACPTSCAVIL